MPLQSLSFLASIVLLAFAATYPLAAQKFDEDFSIWPLDLKINGSVIACAGPAIDRSTIDLFKRSIEQETSKVVVLLLDDGLDQKILNILPNDHESIRLFEKDSVDIDQIKALLSEAVGVLLHSSDPVTDSHQSVLDQIQPSLKSVIDRGGVACAVGPVLTRLGKFRHDTGDPDSLPAKALNLVPDGILYGNYDDSSNRKSIDKALAAKPLAVAIGIPQDTAMVLRGRKCITLGQEKVTFAIASNDRQPSRVQHLANVTGKRSSPYNSVVDLTAWRRDAIERQLPAFPEPKPPAPVVEKGTLFIVGGGGMPRGLMNEMVELAGGKDAHMVYVPCTERDSVSDRPSIIRQWKRMGVASATVFHTKDRNQANSDEDFLKIMKRATGVWFGGGRQWNFADSYYGTRAHKLMKEVLSRGGVIGGSSAGASIQGGYLARANPVANFDIMAPGYERGLGFLPGVAIDQHFSQRGRHKDMTKLADRYPQLLGIGIDEATGLKVQGSVAEIVGRGKVFFYDRGKTDLPDEKDYTALSAGQTFDLKLRQIVQQDD